MKGKEENIMVNPVISIIVPVYNVEKYIKKCVDSILQQTFTEWELILIDDGSTDNCPVICDKYTEKDQRISVIHKENGGLSDARNTGLKKANGKYIFFVDSDDYIMPETLEHLCDAMKGREDTIVLMDTLLVWENRTSTRKSLLYGNVSGQEAVEGLFNGKIPNYAPGKLYPRKMWENVLFPVGKYFEDIGTIYKVFFKCKQVIILKGIGYCYVQRKGSITDRAVMTRMDAIDAYKQQLAFAKVHCVDSIPYLEYRIEETTARYIILKDYKRIPWKNVKKQLKTYRIWIWKHLWLVLSCKLEPYDLIRNMSILLVLVCPMMYAKVYGAYVTQKYETKS